jgi:hypothetical protein
MRQVLLGLFICWQLMFILVANFVSLVPPARPEPEAPAEDQKPGRKIGRDAVAFLGNVTRPWQELTGQWQGWALYAPRVPHQAVFLAVELRWDDDPRWPSEAPNSVPALRSEIEPPDPAHYFRPFGTFRLAQYQANLSLVMWDWNAQEAATKPEVWRRLLADAVRQQWRPMEAYLRWRMLAFERDHAGLPPPRQVLLLARIYRIPPPEQRPWIWDHPVEQALARWRPEVDVPPGFLPVESYNPETRRFEPVRIDE